MSSIAWVLEGWAISHYSAIIGIKKRGFIRNRIRRTATLCEVLNSERTCRVREGERGRSGREGAVGDTLRFVFTGRESVRSWINRSSAALRVGEDGDY